MSWQQRVVSVVALAVFLVTCREGSAIPVEFLPQPPVSASIISVNNKIVCVYARLGDSYFSWPYKEYKSLSFASNVVLKAYNEGTMIIIGLSSYDVGDCV